MYKHTAHLLNRVTIEVDPEPTLTRACVARIALEQWDPTGTTLLGISNVLTVPVLPRPLVQELQHFNSLTGMDDAPILNDLCALLSMASEHNNSPRGPGYLPPDFADAARRLEAYALKTGRRHLAVLAQALSDNRRVSVSQQSQRNLGLGGRETPTRFAAGRAVTPTPRDFAAFFSIDEQHAQLNEYVHGGVGETVHRSRGQSFLIGSPSPASGRLATPTQIKSPVLAPARTTAGFHVITVSGSGGVRSSLDETDGRQRKSANFRELSLSGAFG